MLECATYTAGSVSVGLYNLIGTLVHWFFIDVVQPTIYSLAIKLITCGFVFTENNEDDKCLIVVFRNV